MLKVPLTADWGIRSTSGGGIAPGALHPARRRWPLDDPPRGPGRPRPLIRCAPLGTGPGVIAEKGGPVRRLLLPTLLLVVLALPLRPGPPVARGAPAGRLGLGGMLALVPAALPDFADAAEFYSQAVYADLAGQLAAVGVAAPAEPADDAAAGPWRAALAPLALPEQLGAGFSRVEDRARWQAFFGFSPLDVDEALGVGGAPAELLLLRGRFDQAAVQAAWAASGYRPLDLGGDPVFWLEHVDIGSPGGLGMKYAAVLPDGMLLFIRQPEIARGVLDVLAGRAAPAGASAAAAALLPVAPGGLASAVLVPGTHFAGGLPSGWSFDPRIDATAIATRAADAAAAAVEAAALPPVQTALLGLTAGGPVWPGGL